MKVLILSLFFMPHTKAQYFSEPIRYFEEVKVEKKTESVVQEEKKPIEENKFKWDNYLDENKDEFFREGDYIPPAPFLEVMRRPTAKNILLFEKWKEKKNHLLKRYNDKRVAVLGLRGVDPMIDATRENSHEVYEKLKGYRMVFYFDSMCSSCKGMFQVVNELAENGVYVEAVRLDRGTNTVEGLNIPWTEANPKEVSALKITAVPLLMIFEESTKNAFKVVGKKSAVEILSIIERVRKS